MGEIVNSIISIISSTATDTLWLLKETTQILSILLTCVAIITLHRMD